MCEGFGIIYTKDDRLLFCEPTIDGNCSHSEILERLGMSDSDDMFVRNFVRVEFRNWKPEDFRFDEYTSLPGWVEENRDEIRNKCVALLERVALFYDKFFETCQNFAIKYDKAYTRARNKYTRTMKLNDNHVAYNLFKKTQDEAYSLYEKRRAAAWDVMMEKMKKISGYVVELN